jgi:hypothetical protein
VSKVSVLGCAAHPTPAASENAIKPFRVIERVGFVELPHAHFRASHYRCQWDAPSEGIVAVVRGAQHSRAQSAFSLGKRVPSRGKCGIVARDEASIPRQEGSGFRPIGIVRSL